MFEWISNLLAAHGETITMLDAVGTTLGLIYLWLEYKANIWMWIVGIVMPVIDIFLYFKTGLYADFGMAIYYSIAAIVAAFVTEKITGKKSRKSSTSNTGRIIKNATSAATRTITRDILGNMK